MGGIFGLANMRKAYDNYDQTKYDNDVNYRNEVIALENTLTIIRQYKDAIDYTVVRQTFNKSTRNANDFFTVIQFDQTIGN